MHFSAAVLEEYAVKAKAKAKACASWGQRVTRVIIMVNVRVRHSVL